MANEAGIKFDLFDVADIFKSTPDIADLKPGGNYVAKDLYEAGGVPVLLKALAEGALKYELSYSNRKNCQRKFRKYNIP